MGTEDFIGSIGQFAGNFAPENWMDCDGRTLEMRNYQALFSLLGFTYGGDGNNLFALPDLRKKDANGKPLRFDGGIRTCICVQGIYPSRP